MTRLVSLFFAGIAFILVVYWVLPGANPPEMTVVKPLVPATTVHVADPVSVPVPPPAPVAATPAPAAPSVATAPPPAAGPQTLARAQAACDADPIKCLLEGGHPTDPAETTGTVAAPRKAPAHAFPKPPAKPH